MEPSARPRMSSIPVSPYCEMARWVMERLEIPYVEEAHAPVFHVLANRRLGGGSVVPVVAVDGAVLKDAREVLSYFDARAPEPLRLFPADPTGQARVKELFDPFFDDFAVAVRAWAYAYMLGSNRAGTIRAWVAGAPRLEKMLVPVVYPLLVRAMRSNLKLTGDSIPRERARFTAVLDRVDALLADGRRYLVGDRFTAADLALASLSAPAFIPAEYGGPMPTLAELPPPMRDEVEQLRARPAGQFILRIYREERRRTAREQAAGAVNPSTRPSSS